jgi:hypothetical protein
MTSEKGRKKRSEKLSDSYAARLSRELGQADRQNPASLEGRSSAKAQQREQSALAGMETRQRHNFTRCPHCREYVPIRDTCRGCGTPLD